ncbi:TraV family lipoprotein [Escherichia coli]|nr:TraV family lipoprotein [Escherichia coli]
MSRSVQRCAGNASPRPLRTGEQTAALWIAALHIDNQDVYHQPSSVFFCY